MSGWLTSISSMFTPILRAQVGSMACSASMNAATPPGLCACAATAGGRGSSCRWIPGRRSRRCVRGDALAAEARSSEITPVEMPGMLMAFSSIFADRALAEGLLDLPDRRRQRLDFFLAGL